MNKRITTAIITAGLASVVLLSGCSTASSSTSAGQKTTEAYAAKLTAAEPYPLALMNDSAERANLRERLLRMNNPNKIGYLTELTQNGQVIASFTIKGKVTATASQLTNTNLPTYMPGISSSAITTVDSMGDDGSYGGNEGGQNGIFFFTTNGGLVEYNGIWQYSDVPLNMTSAPVLTMDVNAKPSSTANQRK